RERFFDVTGQAMQCCQPIQNELCLRILLQQLVEVLARRYVITYVDQRHRIVECSSVVLNCNVSSFRCLSQVRMCTWARSTRDLFGPLSTFCRWPLAFSNLCSCKARSPDS